MSKSTRTSEANSVRVPEVEAQSNSSLSLPWPLDQSALNWSPRTHPDSVFDDPHMDGKII